MRQLKEADITINGRGLTQTEAGALRVALQFARSDLEKLPNDLFAVGILGRIDDMLKLIDDTEIAL